MLKKTIDHYRAALHAGYACPIGPAPFQISIDRDLYDNWIDGQSEAAEDAAAWAACMEDRGTYQRD